MYQLTSQGTQVVIVPKVDRNFLRTSTFSRLSCLLALLQWRLVFQGMKDEILKFSLVICFIVGRNLIFAANFNSELMNNLLRTDSTFDMFVISFSRRWRTKIYLRTFIALADLKTASNHLLIVREWNTGINCFRFSFNLIEAVSFFCEFGSLSYDILGSINLALTRWTFRNGLFSEVFDDALLVKGVRAYQFNRLLMSVDRNKAHYAVTGATFV